MSESEGIHGISATWNCDQGFPRSARSLRPHHGANPLPAPRSSFPAADLRLAGLRLVSALSGAEPFSGVLAGEARGAALLRYRRPLAADQARGAALDRRRIPFALKLNEERPWPGRRGALKSARLPLPPSRRSRFRSAGWNYPRPTNGIRLAITVKNRTLVSRGD